MKKQDTIKVAVAVGCLVLAGVLFFVLNSGGGSNSGGGQTIGTSAQGSGEGGRMTSEEVQELAEQEEGVTFGGTGPVKPTPRRR